ncbi:hypothetical protein Bbelb_406710 [Branchiostoma belcheri]|nr:hypothetical protein Bbelb_406710 [Branchiostoma belcheri]
MGLLVDDLGDSQKIIFPGPRGIDDYARMETTLPADLTSFTLCVHMRSNMDSSNEISLVSYAVSENDNELLLVLKGGFQLFLRSRYHYIQMADPPVLDGEWHTICTTWSSSDGAWQLYADGVLTASGSEFNVGGRVRTGGTWILGQDQDEVGGGFQEQQSFIGELSEVNLWDRVLSPAEIAADCSYHGNVIDWDTTNIAVFGQASKAEYQCAMNHCQPDPCVYGTCISGPDNFTCTCDEGYEGETCSISIGYCKKESVDTDVGQVTFPRTDSGSFSYSAERCNSSAENEKPVATRFCRITPDGPAVWNQPVLLTCDIDLQNLSQVRVYTKLSRVRVYTKLSQVRVYTKLSQARVYTKLSQVRVYTKLSKIVVNNETALSVATELQVITTQAETLSSGDVDAVITTLQKIVNAISTEQSACLPEALAEWGRAYLPTCLSAQARYWPLAPLHNLIKVNITVLQQSQGEMRGPTRAVQALETFADTVILTTGIYTAVRPRVALQAADISPEELDKDKRTKPLHVTTRSTLEPPTAPSAGFREIEYPITSGISPASAIDQSGLSATDSAGQLYRSINDKFEATHNISFGKALTKVPEANVQVKKTRAQKQKEKRDTLRRCVRSTEEKWAKTDVANFLSTRENFCKRQQRRMAQYYETREEAQTRAKARKAKEKAGLKKPKRHSPNWRNLEFDREGLLTHVKSLASGSKIVYAALARQYGVGDTPHGSTIVKNFLLDNEVNLDRLSTFRVKGKEPKARRCLNKVYSEITGPKTRCNKQVKDEIKDMLKSGELSMGELIVPQTHTKVTLKDGKVIEEEVTTAGRKIPLNEIQEKLLKKHVEDGFLRPQENYDTMDETTVTRLLEEINENNDTLSLEEKKEKLKTLRTTRHLCRWLDHSTILNTGYLLVTVHTLYDPAVYYTAKELEEQGRGQVDIQSEVEKPEVYLLARSRGSIAEQLLYSDCQRSDLQSLSETVQYKDNQVTDWMRCFIGDGPAQWVEAGEQHIGTYGCSAGCGAPMSRFADLGFCFRRKVKSLEERRQVVVSLPSGASENNKGVCPFKGLKKEELLRNLEATGMEYDTTGNKSVLEQELKEHLEGVSHVPALCFGQQNSTMSEINLLKYEVSPCEPLHVTKEHIKNVFEELPHHLNAKDKPTMNATIKALQQDKEQLRGVDFRKQLLIVTAAMSANNADTKVVQLLSSLATIVHILYTQEKDRSPRLVLRLANLTYMHCMLLREVIGTVTRALTPRKMYGTYYHSLSTHAPLLFRLSNLRSLNAESQERMFSKLKGIYAQSSRRPGEDGMGVLRLQAELSKSSSESKEESEVSALNANLRKILPEENTTVPWEYITTRNFQPHLERISDYLECGEGIWWHQVPTGIEFHDGPKEVNTRTSPTLHHFRSSSMKQEQQYLRERWNECVKKLCDGDLTLPHTRIKICNGPDVSFKSGLRVHDEHLQETADDRELEERELEERELEERELEERELEERELEERELEEREQEERELEKRELEEQGRGHVDIQRELEDREFEGPLAIEDVFPRQAEDREKEGKEEVTFINPPADRISLRSGDPTRGRAGTSGDTEYPVLYNRKLATIQSQVLRKYGEVKEAIKAWEAQFFLSTNNEPTYDDAKKEGVDILYKQRDQAVKFLEHWRMDGLK